MKPTFDADRVRAAFPADLRALPQWVTWRLVPDKKGKPTKVPYSVRGSKASSTNSRTWCSFDDAVAFRQRAGHDGVGFVFTDGVVGIDLDHCRDPETGVVATWAQLILGSLASYTELSPSGAGFHVFVRGKLPGGGIKRPVPGGPAGARVEMYDRARFFTVTGASLAEFPATVEERQDAVAALYERVTKPPPKPNPGKARQPSDLDDQEIVERARAAKNGAAFARLWAGDTSGHGDDDSAADLALCGHLAFWCGPDPGRIDRLFRASGLYREKWDREDYRDRTIDKALDGRTEFFGQRPARRRTRDVTAGEGDDAYLLIPGQHLDDQGEIHEVGTDVFAQAVIERLPKGTLYRMDFIVGELVGETGSLRFVQISEQRLRAVTDSHVRLAKWVARKDDPPERMFVACSRDHAGLLLAAAGASPLIPELKLLVHHPVYLPGLVLARPGWNEEHSVYYDEPPALRGLRPRPENAVEVLRDVVIDFPFKDEASRQNVFGAMVTLVVRPAIPGRVPFHLTMASLERTGKGKLTDTAFGEAVLGKAVAPMQPGRSEEEREKRITALLLQGETVVHLDNLPVGEVLDSPSLASLATSWPFWRGRMLGVSRTPLLPNNLVVFLSGNNPRTTGEIAKRIVPIWLQPKDDRPEERTDFVHKDAEGYARSRRREVLAALLGLVESWKAAGCPAAPHRRTMGGFERWAEAVGGVLALAGMSEWMANYRSWTRAADPWIADAEALIEAWAERHGDQPVRNSDVLEMVQDIGIFTSVTARKEGAAQFSALGKRVLTPLVGRPVGSRQVETDGKGGSKRYVLRDLLHGGPQAREGSDVAPEPEGSEGSEGSFTHPHAGAQARTDARAHAYARARDAWDRAGNPSDPSDPSEALGGARRVSARDGGACGA